ncbi:TrmB family transcriptional regulator [Salinigranum sp. GCM10025319]|uniref:TrmB family transcriptional regulator n=1 Tax=Salinigranum sp. GCM10025319 TaxID=3252687 RepID=UPI00361E88B8
MTSSGTQDPGEQAVEQLTELGLGLYAARTFVALTVLSGGTAVEVSRTADVPRTRVYDAAEELAELDLVDIDDTTPQEFSPVDSDEAAARFLEEYQDRIETLRVALSSLGDGRQRAGD